jgi:putative transcriptional regulator
MALEKNIELAKRFGERITRLREEKGWTKQSLADQLNVERRHILNIEQGRINTSLQMADALARVFGMTLSELLVFEN